MGDGELGKGVLDLFSEHWREYQTFADRHPTDYFTGRGERTHQQRVERRQSRLASSVCGLEGVERDGSQSAHFGRPRNRFRDGMGLTHGHVPLAILLDGARSPGTS